MNCVITLANYWESGNIECYDISTEIE